MKTCRECNAINRRLGTLTSQIPWSLWDNLAPLLFFCLVLLHRVISGVMELGGFFLCFWATDAPISCLDLESILTSPISSEKLALGVKPLVSFPFSTGGCFSERLLFLWNYGDTYTIMLCFFWIALILGLGESALPYWDCAGEYERVYLSILKSCFNSSEI